jgi:hypothetical protein
MKYILILLLAVATCISPLVYGQDTTNKESIWKKLKPKHEAKASTEPVVVVPLPIDNVTGKVTYAKVVNTPQVSKKLLFDKTKKWVITKNTPANPYNITYESEPDGSIFGKGTFTLPAAHRKYWVQFIFKVSVKNEKFKYEFTDLIVQLTEKAGATGFNAGVFQKRSEDRQEVLEYSLETFYPSRITSEKPVIKFFEEVTGESFNAVNREMTSIAGSLEQTLGKDDW